MLFNMRKWNTCPGEYSSKILNHTFHGKHNQNSTELGRAWGPEGTKNCRWTWPSEIKCPGSMKPRYTARGQYIQGVGFYILLFAFLINVQVTHVPSLCWTYPHLFHYFPIARSLFMYHFSLSVSGEDLWYKYRNVPCVHRMSRTLGPPLLMKTCVLQMPKDIRG